MTNTWFLFCIFVTLPLNLKAMHAYAGICGGVNGTTICCVGFQWDIEKQTCKPCKIGYNGINCDIKCVYPSFGKDCQSTCNCKEINCDHVEGCKNSTGKTVSNICYGVNGKSCCFGYQWDQVKQICKPCETGYTGLNCTSKCLYPLYGQGCQSTCKCTKEVCDHTYGCKNPTENICIGINGTECCHGYKWNKEETKCIPCDKGYTGHSCEVICPFPSYGLDCQAICNCTETKCDHVYGCTGRSTNLDNPTSLTQVITTKAVYSKVYQNISTDGNQSMLMIGIGVLGAVALFIVLAIFFTYRLENSNNEKDSNIYYSIK